MHDTRAAYREFLDTVPDGALVVDATGRIVIANGPATVLFGYRHAELEGRSIHDLVPEEQRDAHVDHVRAYGEAPGVRPMGARTGLTARCADGRVVPIDVMLGPIALEGQTYTVAIVRDLTAWRQLHAELEEARAALERQVWARTAELETANEALRAEIRDRAVLHDALHESEARLREAVAVAKIGIFEHDHRTDSIYWSPQQRQIYGLGPDEAITLDVFLAQVHPEDRDAIAAAVERAHDPRGDGRYDVEHRITRRDGEVRWIMTRSETSFEGEGEARHKVRTVGAVVDATDRRRAEESLRRSDARNRALVDAIPDLLFQVDRDGTFVDYHARIGSDLYVEPGRFLGRRMQDVLPPHVAEPALAATEKAIRTQSTVTFEYMLAIGDEQRWYEDRVVPLSTREALSVVRDITDAKRSAEAIRIRDQALETSITPIVMTDLDTRFTYVNRAFRQQWGFDSASDILGQSAAVLADPGKALEIQRELARAGEWLGELTTRRKDGTPLDVQVAASRVVDERGQPIGIMASLVDVTERNRAERQIRAALVEKESLLREVHHRVKNNLQAMISMVHVQRHRVQDAATLAFLAALEDRARTMALVYDQLFRCDNLARVDMARYLGDLANNVLKSFLRSRAVDLELDVGPVSLDVAQAMPCGLIVNELLTNSLKHAFPQPLPRRPKISVGFRMDAGRCALTVADNGVGLPEGTVPGNELTSGLGLVKLWASHQLGGTLEVRGGIGVTYTVRFDVERRGARGS